MTLDPQAFRAFADAYTAAWNSHAPEQVAAFYAADGRFRANQGPQYSGRAGIAEMAAGFYAEFPDMRVICDDVRTAGDHAIYVWTLEGHHAATRNFVRIGGWEEWEIDADMKIGRSLGWFDAADYQRQIQGPG
jgi:uncharacterized protein (TIGR02246 family)